MKKITTPLANAQIIDTVIRLAHCSKRQRILLAGSKAPDRLSDFNRRGFNRVMTTAIRPEMRRGPLCTAAIVAARRVGWQRLERVGQPGCLHR